MRISENGRSAHLSANGHDEEKSARVAGSYVIRPEARRLVSEIHEAIENAMPVLRHWIDEDTGTLGEYVTCNDDFTIEAALRRVYREIEGYSKAKD